jgi:hypothetical protein
LSSPAIRFARSAPHCEHLWTIDHSPFCLTQTATGSIADLQIERLSPDWKSTCLLHRHRGQWFLWLVPGGGRDNQLVAIDAIKRIVVVTQLGSLRMKERTGSRRNRVRLRTETANRSTREPLSEILSHSGP